MSAHAVLYVEDEEFDALFMRKAFAKAGLEECLTVVADGRDAIVYLAGQGEHADRAKYPLPAMVLLDLKLPIVSGFEVLEWIRKQPELRTLPVVIFSSSSRDADKRKAEELGANEYVEKPASAMEFRAVVERLKLRWLAGP